MADPLETVATPDRKCGREQLPVLCDPPPRGGAITDHEEAGHGHAGPAAFACDLRGEPRLAIDSDHRATRLWYGRLHLVDGHNVHDRMPREHIDRPALPELRERDLHRDVPAGGAIELDELVDDGGMFLVDQSIQALATPTKVESELAVDSSRCSRQVVMRDPSDLAQFDPADDAPRQAAPSGEVELAPAPTLSERPDRSAEPESVHRFMMVGSAYLALTADCAAPTGRKNDVLRP